MSKKFKSRFTIEVVVEGAPLEWDSLEDIANGANHGLYQVVDEEVSEIKGDDLKKWIERHPIECNYHINRDVDNG